MSSSDEEGISPIFVGSVEREAMCDEPFEDGKVAMRRRQEIRIFSNLVGRSQINASRMKPIQYIHLGANSGGKESVVAVVVGS